MVYRPHVDEKLCFVLMPFGHPFDSYYQEIIKPAAAEANLGTLRSDEIYSIKPIIKDIWKRIWAARVVVADVTNRNPNVNYELGICDALGVPTIIIAANIADVPFDYKHRRCIVYDRENAGWDNKLRSSLTKTMREVIAETANEEELEWPYDTSLLKEPASVGLLIASGDSRKIVIRGAKLVRDSIGSAYGPRGASVAISQIYGGSKQSQRGSQIANGIKSSNPLEERGIEEIRAGAARLFDSMGDFTKTVSILSAGLMVRGQDLVEKGHHPKDVLASFETQIEKVLNHLRTQARQVTKGELLAVATTAASGDKRTGGLVTEAMKKAGLNGIISLEPSDNSETVLEFQEGLQFGRGYLSDYFVTDPESQKCTLENCLILIYQGRIQTMRDLLPVLEQTAKSERSLLVIADDVEGEALATLVVNKIKGILKSAAVKAPGNTEMRRALIDDIATLTGGKVHGAELGLTLANSTLDTLGKADRVIITSNNTTIIGGAGSTETINERSRAIQSQISNSVSAYDRERLQDRLARLIGRVAILKIGGLSETDLAQERYKLESALNASRAAIENGAVIGGGVALLSASRGLRHEKLEPSLAAEAAEAVASVLEEPMRQLIENAKKSPTQILADIGKIESGNRGFNTESGEIEDLLFAGVLDAAAPIELSLRVAFLHASSILQTGTWDLSTPPQRSGQMPNPN